MSYDARGFIRRWRRASAPRRRSRCPFESPSAARVNFPDVKDVFGGAREEEEEEEGEEAMIGVDRTPRGATILPASLEDDAEAARARELADCTIEKIANECPADITTPGGGGGGGGDGDGDDASEDELVAARRLAKEAREEFRCHEYFARKTTAALAGARDPVLSSPWSPWSPTEEEEEEEDPSPASSVPSPWAPQTARPPPTTTRGESVRGGRARVGLGRRAGTARDGGDDDQLEEFSPVRWQSARIPSPSPMPPPRRARGRKKKTAGVAVDRGVFVDDDDGDAADAVSFTAALEKSLSFDGVKSGLYELFSRCATEPEPATTATDAATSTDDLTENDAGGDGDASIDSFEDDDDAGSAPGIKAFADISPIAVYRAGQPLRVAAANAVVVVDAAAAAAAAAAEEEDDDASPSRRALFAEAGAEAEEEEDRDRRADDDASPTRTPARDASSSLPPPPSRPPRLAKDRRKSRTRVYDEETELDESVVSAIATRLRMEDVALDDVAEVDVGVDVESELASDAAEEVDSDSDLEFPSMVEVDDDDDDDDDEEDEEDAMPTPTAAFATAVGPTLAPATPRLDPPATRRGLLPPIRGARVAVDENSPLSPPAPLPPSPTAAAVSAAAVGESIVVVVVDDDDSRATEETRIALDAERERTPGSAFGRPGYAAASPSESAESAESSREMTSTSTAASASASASAAGATTAGADAGVFLDDSAARNSSIGNSATKRRGDMTDEMKTYLGLDADGLPREDDSAGKKPTRGTILKFGGAGGSERKQLDFEAIETDANATSEDPRAFTKELRRILAELKSEDAATTR